VALQNRAARGRCTHLLRSWFDEHSTTLLTVAVCAIAVGFLVFGASKMFAAHELDDAQLTRSLRIRDNVAVLDSLYADADADFLHLIADPASHPEPWPTPRIVRAEQALDGLTQAYRSMPERLSRVEALRRATHEWQHSVAQAMLPAQPYGLTALLPRGALLLVEDTRHRVAISLRNLDVGQELSAGAHAGQLARRYASERIAFAAAAAAGFIFLVYGFLANHRFGLKRARARISTEEGEARFREYFEEHPLPMLIYDVETLTIAAINGAGVRQYGYEREELAGLSIAALRPPEDGADFIARFVEMAAAGTTSGSTHVRPHVRKDGSRIFVEPSFHFLTYANRRACFVVAIDVTEKEHAKEALRLRSRALDASVNAVLITRVTEEGNLIEYTNPAFERITGYAVDDVKGLDFRFLQGEDRHQEGIESIRRALADEREVTTLLRNYRRDGSLFWNQIYIAPVRDDNGKVTHHISVVNDVTELVQSRDLLTQQANYDSLTALPNRYCLNERLTQAIRDAQRDGTRVAVAFMDIDHFKDVNDSLGHGIGDRLLREISARLSACTSPADTVARYGGDEFVIVVSEGEREDGLTEVLTRVSQAFARPVWIDDTEFYVETSIGVACFPGDGEDPETLLRRADLAMYRAKSNGRNGLQRFTPELGRRADERLALSRRMRAALANGEFRLDYQPQVDLQMNRVTGVEALLRWTDSALGPVSPATFIPIAEENGLIVPIGEWVMQQACFQAQVWQETLPGLRMSVNLSPRQFARGDILRVVQLALTRASLSPRLLELEITEGALMTLGSIDVLRALRAMDIDIAIDDFGTGYSSLSYIRNFHAERLKLDMSFVSGIGRHREDEVITRAILSLGRALGFKVVAEGVETETQLAFLRRHGCSVVQGYRFARPMPAADAHSFISRFNEGAIAYH